MLWDWLIIGSGFGGSVSALRLAEKGYRVLLLEKGRRLGPPDFPKTNWDLKRWFWFPKLGWHGLFKMTFFRHVTIVSGVGVGGGSLVYANTLPVPGDEFFTAPSWGRLADWKRDLEPHYATARRMLGATRNPILTRPDEVIRELAEEIGLSHEYRPTDVAVFFGEPGKTVPDPYFGGEGPDRTGCIACGGCMIGCRHGAKNTLDKNYLWLAERRGLTLEAETEVGAVRPEPGGGYRIEAVQGLRVKRPRVYRARNVVFSGGVLGTVPLLLDLKGRQGGLPRLSDRLGEFVRTNSESLIAVKTLDAKADYSRGIAIGSIVHTDAHSHLEPCRYPAGSDFFRLLAMPHAPGRSLPERLVRLAGTVLRRPVRWLRAMLSGDFAKRSMVLLYMRTLEGTLRFRLGRSVLTGFRRALVSAPGEGAMATTVMPEADDLARRVASRVNGVPMTILNETQGLYVIDGSAVSANPGGNPSLTITALAERATSFIPPA